VNAFVSKNALADKLHRNIVGSGDAYSGLQCLGEIDIRGRDLTTAATTSSTYRHGQLSQNSCLLGEPDHGMS
jgi:hypothetical protein